MFLSPSKCNIYRSHDPGYYGSVPRHTAQLNMHTPGKDLVKRKGVSHDGNRHFSMRLGTLHGKEVFNSTAREDASPDLSCALSCIADNRKESYGETSVHRVTALRTTSFSQCESPVKIFARMKAKVSNQNTPFKANVVHEDLMPAHRMLRPEIDLEKMDVEQYPASVDDTDAFTLSPPNSPGESSASEENDGESNVVFHGGQRGAKVMSRTVPAESNVTVSVEPTVADGNGHTATDNLDVSRNGESLMSCVGILYIVPFFQ